MNTNSFLESIGFYYSIVIQFFIAVKNCWSSSQLMKAGNNNKVIHSSVVLVLSKNDGKTNANN